MITLAPYHGVNHAHATGGAFDPLTLTSLAAWYKSDAGIGLSGSDVDTWADQSGNSRTLTYSSSFQGASSGNRPTISTNIFNGYDGVLFGSGGKTNLRLAANLAFGGAGGIYMVYKVGAAATEVLMGDSFNNYIASRSNQVDIEGATIYSTTPSAGGIYTLNAQVTGGSASKIGLNGVYSSTGTGIPVIRELGWYDFSLHFTGYIAELIVMTAVPTTQENTDVLQYLKDKYAHY